MSNLDQLLPCPACGGEGTLQRNPLRDEPDVFCSNMSCDVIRLSRPLWNELSYAKQVALAVKFLAEQINQPLLVFPLGKTFSVRIVENPDREDDDHYHVVKREGNEQVTYSLHGSLGDALIGVSMAIEDTIVFREHMQMEEYEPAPEIRVAPYENPYDMSDN